MAFPQRSTPCYICSASVVLLGLLLASPALRRMLPRVDTSVDLSHELWMARHDLTYNDEAEKKRRREIFRGNVEYVESFNRRGDRGYTLDVNQFADRSEEEFRTANFGVQPLLEMIPHTAESFTYTNVTDQDVPGSKDWRNDGAVTGVKDQRSCGSCWAFATVAATEGITKISKGRLMSLSEQQLVDCSTRTYGCNGGYPPYAFEYIVDNGITTEDAYPYKGNSGTCVAASKHTAATISSYGLVPSNDEQALLYAVANQPVVVLVTVSREFQLYRSGVFTGPCDGEINHAVTCVGYGTTSDGTKYWILKNSWGSRWGEGGYMRILRDSSDARGLCLLATYASYPDA